MIFEAKEVNQKKRNSFAPVVEELKNKLGQTAREKSLTLGGN